MTHLPNRFRHRDNSRWPAWGSIAPRRTVSSAPGTARWHRPPTRKSPQGTCLLLVTSSLIAAKIHDTVGFWYEHDGVARLAFLEQSRIDRMLANSLGGKLGWK